MGAAFPPRPGALRGTVGARRRLSGTEAGGGGGEELLVGAGAGQKEAHAAAVAQDHRADLQELQTEGARLGAGQFRAGKGEAADGLDQRIGESGQEQPELVGPPFVAGSTYTLTGRQTDRAAAP